MCQMPAMIQIHTHNRVAGLTDRKLHRHIGLCAGMGLYIGIFTAKQFLRPVNCQVFYHIHTLTSAVIPLPRIAFRIFIRQGAAHGRHHCFAHPVLRGNQLNMAVLPCLFVLNGPGNFRVYIPYFIQRIHFQSSFLFQCPFRDSQSLFMIIAYNQRNANIYLSYIPFLEYHPVTP